METNIETKSLELKRVQASVSIQKMFASVFTGLFFLLSGSILIATLVSAVGDLVKGDEITQVIIRIVNTGVIAIAVYELAMVINQEYGNDLLHDVVVMMRRTLPRFVGTVCVALSLEGLIMVIKYSQLDLAGNLYYPVAIISSAALLLMALGIFMKLAPPE